MIDEACPGGQGRCPGIASERGTGCIQGERGGSAGGQLGQEREGQPSTRGRAGGGGLQGGQLHDNHVISGICPEHFHGHRHGRPRAAGRSSSLTSCWRQQRGSDRCGPLAHDHAMQCRDVPCATGPTASLVSEHDIASTQRYCSLQCIHSRITSDNGRSTGRGRTVPVPGVPRIECAPRPRPRTEIHRTAMDVYSRPWRSVRVPRAIALVCARTDQDLQSLRRLNAIAETPRSGRGLRGMTSSHRPGPQRARRGMDM